VEQDKFKGEKRPITGPAPAAGRWAAALSTGGKKGLPGRPGCAGTPDTGSFVEEPWPKRKGGRSEPEEEQMALF